MASITLDTVWRVLVSSSIVILGIPIILYVPALLRIFFMRLLKLEMAYKSPSTCYQEYKKAKKKEKNEGVGRIFFSEQQQDDFYGYYKQAYFKSSPAMRYLRTNVFLLFYVIIQVLILMCLGLAIIWAMDADPTSIFASASIATAIAVFHLADYLRGYFAYIWLVWSNKVKMGDEIDVEGRRGVIVEMGPVVSVIYVFMQNVPLIGSVQTSDPATEKHLTDKEADHQRDNRLVHGHTPQDDTVVLNQIPSIRSGSAQQVARQQQQDTTRTFEHNSVNVPQLPYNMIKHHQLPYRQSIGNSENNPQSLRYFDKEKLDSFDMHGENGSKMSGSTKNSSISRSLATHKGKFIMHRVGYVALPIREHYFMATPTCNFLLNSFKHFDYDSTYDPK